MEIPKPDLRLQVRQRRVEGDLVLSFALEQSNRFGDGHSEAFESAPFQSDPIRHFEALFRSIEQLSDEGDTRERTRRLDSFGSELFRTVLPVGLQRRLWSLPRSARSMLVLSDAGWIPWELMKLQDPDSDGSGPFLAEVLAITRWSLKPGIPRPASVLRLRRVAFVLPRTPGLEHAESGLVDSLRSRERETVLIPARYLEVTEALGQGRYDGWHFAGHGLFMGEQPNQWGIRLDKGKLTSTDLAGEARRLGRARPLVFLNSCNSAQVGSGLMGFEGLASSFIESGAGALVGAYWSIPDDRAKIFAEIFYERLLKAEVPLGEAIRQTRLRLREQFPGDPTWLAYSTFGHPLVTCEPPQTVHSGKSNPPDKIQESPQPQPSRLRDSKRSIVVAVIGAVATLIAALIDGPWSSDQDLEPTRISVRVAERHGAAIPGAEVVFFAEGGPYEDITDSSGAAEVTLPQMLTEARLVVEAADFQVTERLIHPKSDRLVDIRLERLNLEAQDSVLFRVIDGTSGQPVKNAEVQLFLGADPLLQTTDSNGLVKFLVEFQEGLADVQLSIQAPDQEIKYQRVTLRPDTVQDVLLDRRSSLSGASGPTKSSSQPTHEVVLVLPSTMTGAEIQVDGRPAVVLKDLGLFVTLEVPAKNSNHHFEVRKGEQFCSQKIRIGPDTQKIQPCEI